MYVAVMGDYRFGVTAVIGPFEDVDDVWESQAREEVLSHQIFEVVDSTNPWGDDSYVSLIFDKNGRLKLVSGPYCPVMNLQPIDGVFRVVGPEAYLIDRYGPEVAGEIPADVVKCFDPHCPTCHPESPRQDADPIIGDSFIYIDASGWSGN